ncbi:MAG: helix-turn-helix domain-containing protein [Bacteroidota bacterium]
MSEQVLMTISKTDLQRLIIDSVTACLNVSAPSLAPLGVEEAASYLKVSPSTIYKKIDDIPHRKVGKRLYFTEEGLNQYLNIGKVKTRQEIESEAATHVALT